MVTKPKLYDSGRPWCRVRLKRLQLKAGRPPCTGGPLMAEAVNAAARRKSDTWNKGQEPGAKGQCEAWHIPVPASRNSSGRFDYKVREESRGKHAQAAIPPLCRGTSSHTAASAEGHQANHKPTLALARLKEPEHLPSGQPSLILWGCSRPMRGLH